MMNLGFEKCKRLHANTKAGVLLWLSCLDLPWQGKLFLLCALWLWALRLDWRACVKTWRRIVPIGFFVVVANAWAHSGEALFDSNFSPSKTGLLLAAWQCFYLFWLAACVRILWCLLDRREWLQLLLLIFLPLNLWRKHAAHLMAQRLHWTLEALDFYLTGEKIGWAWLQQEINDLKQLAQQLEPQPSEPLEFLPRQTLQAMDWLLLASLVVLWLLFKSF